jgi:hypothetical protein
VNGRTGRNIIFSEVGLTLQFVVGDKDEILDAVEQSDFDFIHRLQNEKRLADFSLHLIPDDLNLLVNAAAELLGERLFGLRENLDLSEYGVDTAEADGGAMLVNPIVANLFSRFESKAANDIASRWVEKMEAEHGEQIGLNSDIISSVRQLIDICKVSVDKKLDLVHIWYP